MDSGDYPEFEGYHPIEPTKPVTPSISENEMPRTQPYFSTGYLDNPYNSVPVPPPPPHIKKVYKPIVVALILLMASIVLLATGVIYYQSRLLQSHTDIKYVTFLPSQTAKQTVPSVVPTVPTASADVGSVTYTARDILNQFKAAMLGGGIAEEPDPTIGCCTYIPGGGSIAFTGVDDGRHYIIATFKNNDEANVNASVLGRNQYGVTVINKCLLSYDANIPASILKGYTDIMNTYCT